jgi:hypothetical protein
MAAISKGQKWIGGGIAAAVVIAAAGWFLLVSPELSAADDAQTQLADAQTQNIVQQNRLNSLREQASHTGELHAELQDALQAVPPSHDVEGFTRQLSLFAQKAGVTVTSISPSSPTQVELPEAAAPSSETADGSDKPASDDATSSDTSSQSTAPTTSAAPSAAGNLYSITVTVVTTGTMAGQREFLSAIEKQGERRALVTSTAFSPIEERPAPGSAAATTTRDGSTAAGSAEAGGAATTSGSTTAAPTTTPPPPSDSQGQWSLTTQLMIFVAPQSSDQEAQLLDQLGGNG